MLTRSLLSVLILALAGCASVDDLRKKEPVFFATTDKSPQVYGECVAQGWRHAGGGEVDVLSIRNGVDVVHRSGGNVEEVVRVQHYDNRTHVNMYTRLRYRIPQFTEITNLCLS